MPQAQPSALGLATGSGPVGPTLCHGPLGGLNLSAAAPVALIRSLLPGPACPHTLASVHRPLLGQSWPWTAEGRGSEMQATPGQGRQPRKTLPACPFPPSICPSSVLGNMWDRALPPQGAVLRDLCGWIKGAQLSPPAPRPPFTGFGIHSLCSQGTLEGKWENPIIFKKKKEDTTRRKRQTSRFSSSPTPWRGRQAEVAQG